MDSEIIVHDKVSLLIIMKVRFAKRVDQTMYSLFTETSLKSSYRIAY